MRIVFSIFTGIIRTICRGVECHLKQRVLSKKLCRHQQLICTTARLQTSAFFIGHFIAETNLYSHFPHVSASDNRPAVLCFNVLSTLSIEHICPSSPVVSAMLSVSSAVTSEATLLANRSSFAVSAIWLEFFLMLYRQCFVTYSV